MPTLEYVKQEQKQEKPSIRDQLRTAAKQQPEKKMCIRDRVYIMSQEQLSMYATYMSVLGNREDLFGDSPYVDKYITNPPADYDVNPEYLNDEKFAALITEAEKYLDVYKRQARRQELLRLWAISASSPTRWKVKTVQAFGLPAGSVKAKRVGFAGQASVSRRRINIPHK